MKHISSTFSPNTHHDPASFSISTRGYKDLDFSGRHVGDEVVFVLKGRVTRVAEDFEDKDELEISMEVETIEDHSTRAGLDSDGRVN